MKAVMTLKTLTTILAAWILTACGVQEDAKQEPKAVDTADLTEALNCAAVPAPAAALTADPELRAVPADQLRLLNGETQQSLCDLFRAGGKKTMVVQFVSVRCYACMKWIDSVQNGLAKKGYTDVLPVVVMTDRLETLNEDEAKALKRDLARKSTWVHDFYGDLWTFFGTTPWDPGTEPTLKPVLVAMDGDARGYYTEDTTLDGGEIGALTEKLFEVDVSP